ncbi:MAG: (2Fe-2S)-binding protein [Alphaproteobacteria bacterium]|nr:(2Fe-2S)-binding protein [Alphaproteobacteria bacterium]
MYVCLCYGVTDHNISEHLCCIENKTTVNEVHKACSGAPEQKCGKCSPTIKEMVDHHNNAITISEISDAMKKLIKKKSETM